MRHDRILRLIDAATAGAELDEAIADSPADEISDALELLDLAKALELDRLASNDLRLAYLLAGVGSGCE